MLSKFLSQKRHQNCSLRVGITKIASSNKASKLFRQKDIEIAPSKKALSKLLPQKDITIVLSKKTLPKSVPQKISKLFFQKRHYCDSFGFNLFSNRVIRRNPRSSIIYLIIFFSFSMNLISLKPLLIVFYLFKNKIN